MTSPSTSLTQPRRPEEPSSVVTVTPSARAPRLDDPEQPVLGRRAEHHLDVAAALAQRLGQPEQRRRAVAAADEHAGHRLGGQRERPAERADDVDRVVGAQRR